MKIYILSAVIFFCDNAFGMEEPTNKADYSSNDPLLVVPKASGFSESEYILQTQINRMADRRSTLIRLLSVCPYLSHKQARENNPFHSKF